MHTVSNFTAYAFRLQAYTTESYMATWRPVGKLCTHEQQLHWVVCLGRPGTPLQQGTARPWDGCQDPSSTTERLQQSATSLRGSDRARLESRAHTQPGGAALSVGQTIHGMQRATGECSIHNV
jgi:hypothetical protein